MKIKSLFLLAITACLLVAIAGCSAQQKQVQATTGEAEQNEDTFEKLPGVLKLDKTSGPVLTQVQLHGSNLTPNVPAKIVWNTVEGHYELKNVYQFVKINYTEKQVELATADVDETGQLTAAITVPEDFGGDHDILVYQNDKLVAKTNFFVETTFTIDSTEGPIGSWITIKGQGIGWRNYENIWHVLYDNKYTGMITAVSTNGTAEAKIRAAGPVGKHSIIVESGGGGMTYMNIEQSPFPYLTTHRFEYMVTDEPPAELTYVTALPEQAAGGGTKMPEPQNAPGVTVSLSKDEGTVNETITLTAEGLPKNKEVAVVWHTMEGNRVKSGFAEATRDLGKGVTDENGTLQVTFQVPDDLGGLPHLIDLVADGEIVGQTYFQLVPSIVGITPSSGPAGTEFTIEVKGIGWSEFDNLMNVVYDNAFLGYVCGFNSQGTVKIKMTATGEPGYHLIDLYPGIYKGESQFPSIYLRPQLTYEKDHPGSRIPSIHLVFEITE